MNLDRAVEDYAVVYIGSAVFKIMRLLAVATFSVHLFACMFFRVKLASASTIDDVAAFYSSRDIKDDVSCALINYLLYLHFILDDNHLQDLMNQYVSKLLEQCHLVPYLKCCWFVACAAGLFLLCPYNVYNCGIW